MSHYFRNPWSFHVDTLCQVSLPLAWNQRKLWFPISCQSRTTLKRHCPTEPNCRSWGVPSYWPPFQNHQHPKVVCEHYLEIRYRKCLFLVRANLLISENSFLLFLQPNNQRRKKEGPLQVLSQPVPVLWLDIVCIRASTQSKVSTFTRHQWAPL